MHQFVGSLPHRALRDMAKKHGPLMHLRLGEVSTIVVSSPEIARELLSPKRVESCQPIREEELSTAINWIASKAGSTINLTENIFTTAYGITSRAAFGKKRKDQETFISIVKEMSEVAAGFNITDVFPSVKLFHLISGVETKLERMHQEVDRIMGNIINEHEEQKATEKKNEDARAEDLVDVLLKFHQEHSGDNEFSLTISNIKAVIMDLSRLT
uniref:Cytochrome P450 n=1 Tax=Fagus sylvatica TaxID=28930 RepID=A0A2N9I191_FAGSY